MPALGVLLVWVLLEPRVVVGRLDRSGALFRAWNHRAELVHGEDAAVEAHPLLAEERKGKRLIVLFTTDRGLAGSLNTNTIRFAAQEIAGSTGGLQVATVGRKGTAAMRRAHVPLAASFDGFGDLHAGGPALVTFHAVGFLLQSCDLKFGRHHDRILDFSNLVVAGIAFDSGSGR